MDADMPDKALLVQIAGDVSSVKTEVKNIRNELGGMKEEAVNKHECAAHRAKTSGINAIFNGTGLLTLVAIAISVTALVFKEF